MTPAWCLLAESASHTFYRFARLQSMSDWWHWLLLVICCAALAAYVVIAYWYDSVELSRGARWSLTLLRLAAFAGILFFFLGMEKRTEESQIRPSRAILLVDTSQSMGLPGSEPTASTGPSRMDQIVAELRGGELLRQLRARHDVSLYQFDEQAEPTEVAFFPRVARTDTEATLAARDLERQAGLLQTARGTLRAAAALAALAALALVTHLALALRFPRRAPLSLALPLCVVTGVAAVVVLAIASLRTPGFSWSELAGWTEPDLAALAQSAPSALADSAGDESADEQLREPDDIPWQQTLVPRGTQTRLGDAVRAIVTRERGGPIAGMVLLTDGGNNAGIDVDTAGQLARSAGIPVHAVGVGSDRQPMQVRMVDLEAPKRVYPGDKFSVTGYVQANGLQGQTVTVELASAPVDRMSDDADVPEDQLLFEDERTVRLAADGEVLVVRFEVTPSDPGTRQYFLKVVPPRPDIDHRENVKSARVTVVERRSRVLLMAGGPSREYQFLRNQLFRDRDAQVDVLLQSAEPGISQDADNVLFEFPELADELFQYDCIIAFDPDWLKLDELQVEMLDRWVAEQAGGLIVVAGPVFTPDWSSARRGRDPRIDTIKALYPVVFYSQGGANLSLGQFGGDAAWPLSFTRDGAAAEFLWLADDALDSEAAWQSFDGVYGYYAVKDPKPGARVYARFANPETAIDGELPIYAAAHFYGSGRVFFQASGEMWRLRGIDPSHFETYYTKLIRWVSQGRLLRDSSRGVLLVDKDRCLLGDQVTVRAVLSDAQFRPLTADSVAALLRQPDGQRGTLQLQKVKDAAREGMYETQFSAMLPGDYRIELAPPDGDRTDLLATEVRVRIPALELERPQRDDALLRELTRKTDGEYYIGFDAAMRRGGSTRPTLASVLEPNDQVIYLPETVDKIFDERLMGWLMTLIVGVLCLEWLIRRLGKLA